MSFRAFGVPGKLEKKDGMRRVDCRTDRDQTLQGPGCPGVWTPSCSQWVLFLHERCVRICGVGKSLWEPV